MKYLKAMRAFVIASILASAVLQGSQGSQVAVRKVHRVRRVRGGRSKIRRSDSKAASS